MEKTKVVSYLLVALLLISCFKQDTPDVSSHSEYTSREQVVACESVSFYKGFLLHNNLKSFFVCSGWNKKFPDLTKALVNVGQQEWDVIFSPLDEAFFGNSKRRDKVISALGDLDNQGGLDDLGKVIGSLSESNFYDSFTLLLKCGLDKRSCRGVDNITKTKILSVFNFLNLNSSSYSDLSVFLKGLVSSLKNEKVEFRESFLRFYRTKFFTALRIFLIDEITNGLGEELDIKEIDYFITLLKGGYGKYDDYFLIKYIHSDEFSITEFKSMLEGASRDIGSNPLDLRVLGNHSSREMLCETGSDEVFGFSLNPHILRLSKVLSKNSLVAYNDELVKMLGSFLIVEESCPGIRNLTSNISSYHYDQRRNINHSLDSVEYVKKISKWLNNEGLFKIVSFMSKWSNEVSVDDYPILLKMSSGKVFNVAWEINKVVDQNSNDFYELLLRVIKRMTVNDLVSLTSFSEEVLTGKGLASLRNLSSLWSFFTISEKNFFFNFIDAHLEEDADYTLLFDFYIFMFDEFLVERKIIYEKWLGDSTRSDLFYGSLIKFSSSFAGAETLNDFRSFFSRDHIIEVLKFLTGNLELKGYSNVLSKSISNKVVHEEVKISKKLGSFKNKCLDAMLNEYDFLSLMKKFPASCMDSGNISIIVLKGLSDFLNSYSLNAGIDLVDVVSENGLFSSRLKHSLLASLKRIDDTFKGSLESVSSSFYNILLNKDLVSVSEEAIDLFNKFFPNDKSSIQYRNYIVRDVLRSENRDFLVGVGVDLDVVLNDYSQWRLDFLPKEYTLSSSSSCKDYLNRNIGTDVCPDLKKIKKESHRFVKRLNRVWQKSEGAPIDYFWKALAGNGVKVPLDHYNAKEKKIDVDTLFRFFYDLTDKSITPFNKYKVRFKKTNSGNVRSEQMTTMERLEVVVRNVSFRDNYLGVQYKNAVAAGTNYNKEVTSKRKLLNLCVNAPGVRCGKRMSKSHKRMAKNALWSYDGLLDLNNGFQNKSPFMYGDFLQVVLTSLVGSSRKDAQKVTFWPLDDSVLKYHNGKMLSWLADAGALSNVGRVLHDRVGRTRSEFEDFMSGVRFKRFENSFLKNVNYVNSLPKIKRLLKRINTKDGVIDDVTSWIYSLEYNDQRLVEEMAARALVVLSFVGSEKSVFGTVDSGRFTVSPYPMIINVLDVVVPFWSNFKASFGNNYSVMSILKNLEGPLTFFEKKLIENKSVSNSYYRILNEVFNGVNALFFKNYNVTTNKSLLVNGKKYLKLFLSENSNVSVLYSTVDTFHSRMKALNVEDYKDLSVSLNVLTDKSLNLSHLSEYFYTSTFENLCEEDLCEENHSYDSFYKTLMFLNSKKNDSTWGRYMLNSCLFNNKKELMKLKNEVFPSLIVKRIQNQTN